MRELCVELRNATIYPPWGQIFKNIFSKTYSFLIWIVKLVPKVTFETYWGEESSGALQITILRIVRRRVACKGKWVGNHFHMAKWTLIYGANRQDTHRGTLQIVDQIGQEGRHNQAYYHYPHHCHNYF